MLDNYTIFLIVLVTIGAIAALGYAVYWWVQAKYQKDSDEDFRALTAAAEYGHSRSVSSDIAHPSPDVVWTGGNYGEISLLPVRKPKRKPAKRKVKKPAKRKRRAA